MPFVFVEICHVFWTKQSISVRKLTKQDEMVRLNRIFMSKQFITRKSRDWLFPTKQHGIFLYSKFEKFAMMLTEWKWKALYKLCTKITWKFTPTIYAIRWYNLNIQKIISLWHSWTAFLFTLTFGILSKPRRNDQV